MSDDALVRFYTDLARAGGGTTASVGLTPHGQRKRFDALARVGSLEGTSVLDVGCGCGHLVDYFDENGIHVEYTGVDMTPHQIALAQELHPALAERFRVANLLTAEDLGSYDYVLANGPLNVAYDRPLEQAKELIRRMFDLCTVGIAITMASAMTKLPNPAVYYFDPRDVIEEAMALTNNWRLDHTYLPHDFALFCYRRSLHDNPAIIERERAAAAGQRLETAREPEQPK